MKNARYSVEPIRRAQYEIKTTLNDWVLTDDLKPYESQKIDETILLEALESINKIIEKYRLPIQFE